MHRVETPYPGTFYRRPSPQSDPFVEVGQRVEPGTVIGLVEIMKNFLEVRSDANGIVERFLVEEGALVDAGQAILELG